jgi:hypothetical protein
VEKDGNKRQEARTMTKSLGVMKTMMTATAVAMRRGELLARRAGSYMLAPISK